MWLCARGNDNLWILANACDDIEEREGSARPPVFGCCWPRCPQTRLSTLRSPQKGARVFIRIVLIYAADWIEGDMINSLYFSLVCCWVDSFFVCGFIALEASHFHLIYSSAPGWLRFDLTWPSARRFECALTNIPPDTVPWHGKLCFRTPPCSERNVSFVCRASVRAATHVSKSWILCGLGMRSRKHIPHQSENSRGLHDNGFAYWTITKFWSPNCK